MSLNEPYHVTIEVINKKCKGLRLLESSGVEQYTLVDVRSLPEGLTRHLITIPKEQVTKTLPESNMKWQAFIFFQYFRR